MLIRRPPPPLQGVLRRNGSRPGVVLCHTEHPLAKRLSRAIEGQKGKEVCGVGLAHAVPTPWWLVFAQFIAGQAASNAAGMRGWLRALGEAGTTMAAGARNQKLRGVPLGQAGAAEPVLGVCQPESHTRCHTAGAPAAALQPGGYGTFFMPHTLPWTSLLLSPSDGCPTFPPDSNELQDPEGQHTRACIAWGMETYHVPLWL